MRRFVLVVTLGSLALLSFPAAAALVSWPGGTNARIVFLNEMVAPDTYSVAPIDDEWATLRFAFSATGDAAPKGGVRTADHVERLLL